MADWRARVAADPDLHTGRSLPLAQLHDHLTALLENLEQRLGSGSAAAGVSAELGQQGDASAHGLHRWQQGFDLAELIRELGRLNESVVHEIDLCVDESAPGTQRLLAEVHAIWAGLYSVATSSSADQYFRLQQIEAASHVRDLEVALESLQEMELQRGRLWEQVAHDLRGNVSVVSLAATGLVAARNVPGAQDRLFTSLDRNIRGLHDLLHDVTGLARLESGQESIALDEMDVAALLNELAGGLQAVAMAKGLELRAQGPAPFPVRGDAVKTRRIVQNLVLNALRYTDSGSVVIGWGRDPQQETDRWFIQVRDTGPGLRVGPGSPLAAALSVASSQAQDVQRAGDEGAVVHVSIEESAPVLAPDGRGVKQGHGEGIGLSIVKRLCTLMDATLHVDSSAEKGTLFRILLPVRYPS